MEFTNFKFTRQTGYGTFSVSESMIVDVKKYVLNQKEHHRKISFAEEYKKFEEKYGLVTGNRFIGFGFIYSSVTPTTEVVG